MKRILSLIMLVAVVFSSLAGSADKKYKKLIQELDVCNEAKTVESPNQTLFIKTCLDNNEHLLKFAEDMKKKKGAEKEALNKVAKLPKFYPQYDKYIVESLQGFCDTILMDMGITDLNLNCSLHIYYDEAPNAFAALTENGFAICVTTGLFNAKGVNYDILMGYVAHEFAHGALLHHIRCFYAEAKERRKNELIGGIVAGLTGVSAALDAYNTAAYGLKPSGIDYGATISKIGAEVKLSTLKYSFKYSREQEFEADLFAYRFLAHLGCGEEYINGLRILGTEYDTLYNEYSDHPTTTSRIEFLKYVAAHPELGNTKNAKLKKERELPILE